MSDQDNPVGKVEIPVDSTEVPKIPQDPEIARLADQQREISHLVTLLYYVRTLGENLDAGYLRMLSAQALADCREHCPNTAGDCLARDNIPLVGSVEEMRAILAGRLRQQLQCRHRRIAASLDGEAAPQATVPVAPAELR